MEYPSRLRLAGVASVAALVVTVFVAGALDPTVRALPVRARLSDLGRPGAPGALVFGPGLGVTAVLGLAAVGSWWRAATSALDRAAVALAGVAFLGLGIAGLFPAPSVTHLPALALGYLAGWTAALLDGLRLRDAPTGRTRAGRALRVGAAVVALLWLVRGLVAVTFVLSGPTSALLLPELATLALFGGWVLFRARGGARAAVTTGGAGPGVSVAGP